MERTGWAPGMLQDDSRELSRWLAGRQDSPRQAREVAHQIEEQRMNQNHDNLPPAFDYAATHGMAATKEWCRGWDDALAAVAAQPSREAVATLRVTFEGPTTCLDIDWHGEGWRALVDGTKLYTHPAPQAQRLTVEVLNKLTGDTRIAFGEQAGAFNDGVDAMSNAVEEFIGRAPQPEALAPEAAQVDEVDEDAPSLSALVESIKQAHDESLDGEHASSREILRSVIHDFAALTQRPAAPLATDAGDTRRLDWLLPHLHPANFGIEFPGGYEWEGDAEFLRKWRSAIDTEMADTKEQNA